MGRRKKYKSIEDYKQETQKIQDLIGGLITIVKVFEKLPEFPQLKSKAKEFEKIMDDNPQLKFDKEKIDNIYELGFIRLFASFEAFMYEYLKELYIKYPDSLPTDRKIQVSDILDWKTKKSVNDFIVDHIAIENSYDLKTWERTLKGSFGIEVFENKEKEQLFNSLNLCRNMIAHSGGKTNSKIVRDFKKIFKDSDEPKGKFEIEKWDIFDKKLFNSLIGITGEIINRLEKNNA
ncbi:Hypothetical protein I595_3697 [Croceitalea dokdonensis DOKDO 023]|uniref:RiboL-PSP-HEPN domain-containing protein n=1 Tax=Croceitalea dokdonensis DOKDO 023 TaxID=1300341 RepID=A0A0N8H3C9_9FLAO|nr:HEPN domain-containing protein [Croceitalea dokdonensis]KPM30220.1 Hypothetical protein I595_3697 [Croceitalea dokdonensis DOKDO 023]